MEGHGDSIGNHEPKDLDRNKGDGSNANMKNSQVLHDEVKSGNDVGMESTKLSKISMTSGTVSGSVSSPSSRELQIFKTPDAPPAKKKRIVLEENKYAEELEKIVQRDFFPDLEKLKAQNAYLNAMENNDIHMLRELYSKYSLDRKTPRLNQGLTDTPSTFETPIEVRMRKTVTPATATSVESTPTHLPMETPSADSSDALSVTSKSSSKSSAKNMSLNTYLDTYTSEDNQSFQDIMEEADRKHRMKYSWLYEAEEEHSNKSKTSLALPSIEEQAEEYKRPLNIDSWTYRNKNYIMYVPDGVAFTPEEEVEMAKKKPEVILNNTRFEVAPFKDITTSADVGGKTTLFKAPQGKIGLDGKEIESDTPKVNGFSIVKTPSPTPGVEESPFMTWGEIEGTPFRLDGSDTPIPSTSAAKPFRMLNTSKREKLAIELAEKVSQRYRDKKQKAIEAARFNLHTPSPRPASSLDRLTSMSPAAQKFAKSHFSSRVSTDKALRESYTPKRIGTPAGLKTPTPGVTPRKTPSSRSAATSTIVRTTSTPTPSFSGNSVKGNITDNLLHLPKSFSRPKAADFF